MENRIAGVWVNAETLKEIQYGYDAAMACVNEFKIPNEHPDPGAAADCINMAREGYEFIKKVTATLDESQSIPVNQDDYWKKRCEAAENYLHNYHLWLAYVETDKEGDERTKAFKNYHKYFKEWQQLKSNSEPIPVQEGLREDTIKEIAHMAWKGAAWAYRVYPDNKHTFFDYWDGAKSLYDEFRQTQPSQESDRDKEEVK